VLFEYFEMPRFDGAFRDVFVHVVLPFLSHWDRLRCRSVNGWYAQCMDQHAFPKFTMDGSDSDDATERICGRFFTAANTTCVRIEPRFHMPCWSFFKIWRESWLSEAPLRKLALPEHMWHSNMASMWPQLRSLTLFHTRIRNLFPQSIAELAPQLEELCVTLIVDDQVYDNLIRSGGFTALHTLKLTLAVGDDYLVDDYNTTRIFVDLQFLKALPKLTHLSFGDSPNCCINDNVPYLPTVTQLTLKNDVLAANTCFFLCSFSNLHTLSVPVDMVVSNALQCWLTRTFPSQGRDRTTAKHKQLQSFLPHIKHLIITRCAHTLPLEKLITLVAKAPSLQRITLKNVHPYWHIMSKKILPHTKNVLWNIECTPPGLVGWFPRFEY
jgi:hypothetical protein